MGTLFLLGAGAALASLVAVRLRARAALRDARTRLRAAPRVALGDLGTRRARVEGHAVRAGSVIAPASGRPVAAWRVEVDEEIGGAWHLLGAVQSRAPFVLAADGVRAEVHGPFELLLTAERSFELDGRQRPRDEALRALSESVALPVVDGRGLPRRLRFRERVLSAGDPVFIVGVAGPSPTPTGAYYREIAPTRSVVGTRRAPVLVCADPETLRPSIGPA
ncbi:MAG: hypothetical protein AAGH15_00525 [Myxococcota bacterium]